MGQVGHAIENAAHDTGHALEKAGQDTGHALEKGTDDTGHTLEKAAHDVGDFFAAPFNKAAAFLNDLANRIINEGERFIVLVAIGLFVFFAVAASVGSSLGALYRRRSPPSAIMASRYGRR